MVVNHERILFLNSCFRLSNSAKPASSNDVIKPLLGQSAKQPVKTHSRPWPSLANANREEAEQAKIIDELKNLNRKISREIEFAESHPNSLVKITAKTQSEKQEQPRLTDNQRQAIYEEFEKRFVYPKSNGKYWELDPPKMTVSKISTPSSTKPTSRISSNLAI